MSNQDLPQVDSLDEASTPLGTAKLGGECRRVGWRGWSSRVAALCVRNSLFAAFPVGCLGTNDWYGRTLANSMSFQVEKL